MDKSLFEGFEAGRPPFRGGQRVHWLKQLAMDLCEKYAHIDKLWEHLNGQMRQNMRSSQPKWPRCVFAPSIITGEFINSLSHKQKYIAYRVGLGTEDGDLSQNMSFSFEDRRTVAAHFSVLTGLGSWVATQGIYSFDPNLFEQVWQPYSGPLSENLLRLPEWTTFMQFPSNQLTEAIFGPGGGLTGLLVWLDWDDEEGMSLRLYPFSGRKFDLRENSLTVRLQAGKTMEDAVHESFSANLPDDLKGTNPEDVPSLKVFVEFFQCLVSVVSYLGDRNADFERRSSLPYPKRTIRGAKFPDVEPVIFKVGSILGPVLGKMKEIRHHQKTGNRRTGGPGGSPLVGPSVTRAHREGYWVKQEDGEKKLEDRWKFAYFRGFQPEHWMDRPVVLRKVLQVQPSLQKRYPELAIQLNVTTELPRIPDLYTQVKDSPQKVNEVQVKMGFNRKGDFKKKKKKKNKQASL